MINGGIINTVAAAAEVCTTNNSSFPVANTAYYKLDGDAIDSSGNGYNGTSPNVTWGVGRFGPAGVFNGSSSYISTGINFSTLPNTKSISMWIKSTGSSSVGFGGVNGSYGNNGLFSFDESAGNVAYIPKFGGYHTGDASTIITNAWNHFVVTDTNVDGNVKIYINGSEVTVTKVNSVVYTNNTNMQIGRQMRNNGATFWQTGEIDQVRIFNTVLTANQVTELYEDEIECCTTDEVNYPVTNLAYYQLNGGTGTTVVDETGTYNATSTNVTYGAGLFDDAAVFNGTSSRAQVPFASKPSLSTCTVSFWLKTTSSNTQALVGEGYSGNHWGNLQIYLASNKLNARSGNASNAEDLPWLSTSNVNTGSWVHCLVTMQGNTSKIYINGNLETTKTLTVTRAATTNPFTIGQFYANGTLFSAWTNDCLIDQVRIFPTAITAGQVAELYQEKQCGPSGPIPTTLNPSDISYGSLSAGNLRFTSTATPWSLCRTIVGVTSGKYYFEMYVHIATNNSLGIGIAESTLSMSGSLWGQSAGGINYYGQNGVVFENGASILTYSTYGVGTTLMCAFDMTSGKIWFGKNGTWFGNPANGTSPASSNIKNYITTAKPFANAYYVGNSVEMNFGSGNSVNSGGFTYTPPSGFGPILS